MKCIWNLPTRGNTLHLFEAGSEELQVPPVNLVRDLGSVCA